MGGVGGGGCILYLLLHFISLNHSKSVHCVWQMIFYDIVNALASLDLQILKCYFLTPSLAVVFMLFYLYCCTTIKEC